MKISRGRERWKHIHEEEDYSTRILLPNLSIFSSSDRHVFIKLCIIGHYL